MLAARSGEVRVLAARGNADPRAARTPGSDSTRRPNARAAGLIWYRRSSWSAAFTAPRSASLNWR